MREREKNEHFLANALGCNGLIGRIEIMQRWRTFPALPAFPIAVCLGGIMVASHCSLAAKPTVLDSRWLISTEPSYITFVSSRQRQRVLVAGEYGREFRDLSRQADFKVADPQIAKIKDGIVEPCASGQTTLLVSVSDVTATINVTVTGFNENDPVSFYNETLAIFTRHDCNSGGCHGAPSGKAGFRLSLFAFDPNVDKQSLVEEVAGRRTNRFDPQLSLLLQKPLMRVAHGGGKRLHDGSSSYQILHDWIAEGCRIDFDTASKCTSIELLPRDRVLKHPHWTQQIVVQGYYADGSIRDVTHLASIFSADETVATVRMDSSDEHAQVTGINHGETAIVARYLDQVAATRLSFVKTKSEFVWTDPPQHNYVDEHVFAKLRQMQFSPSTVCSDQTFVRRIYLDVVGLLPTQAEARGFVEDESSDKRNRLIDELLNSRDHARFWATRWADLLRVRDTTMDKRGVHKFNLWLVEVIQKNMPYDQFVRELLASSGNTFETPASNYYRSAADTDDCTETTARTFLGVRIQCAKCHNHPYERWTQDNYYGISAFFNRLQRTEDKTGARVIWVARTGEVEQPRTGQTMEPWLPAPFEMLPASDHDRRQSLVDWLTSPDNRYFPAVEVNRIWSQLFGTGVVDAIDDFRDSNPPSNPELLSALAADFVNHEFDRRHIIRTILRSCTYQLNSKSNSTNEADRRYFSHYPVRRMTAEQTLDAICLLTGVDESFDGLPIGIPATQLPTPEAGNEFLRTFGKPERNTACACERSNSSDLAQALNIVNGTLIDEKLRDKRSRFRKWIQAGYADREIVSRLFWIAFSREPTQEELRKSVTYIEAQGSRETAYEDVVWALINRKEFLFQH